MIFRDCKISRLQEDLIEYLSYYGVSFCLKNVLIFVIIKQNYKVLRCYGNCAIFIVEGLCITQGNKQIYCQKFIKVNNKESRRSSLLLKANMYKVCYIELLLYSFS